MTDAPTDLPREGLDASKSSWYGLSPDPDRLRELQEQLEQVSELERRAEVAASSSLVF